MPAAHNAACTGTSSPRLEGIKGAVAWEKYLDIRSPVVFVQVGAHEGNVGDAMWPYATTCTHWRGLLLEPTRDSFHKLCANYAAHQPRICALKAAASDYTGEAKIQIMRNGCPRGQCNHLLNKGDNVRWHHRWARTNQTERVAVITLARVWEELKRVHGPIATVSLLVVDVEGSEDRLLGPPLPSPRPRLVMFEHKHLSMDRQRTINASLLEQGYSYVGGVAGGVGGNGARHGDSLYAHN